MRVIPWHPWAVFRRWAFDRDVVVSVENCCWKRKCSECSYYSMFSFADEYGRKAPRSFLRLIDSNIFLAEEFRVTHLLVPCLKPGWSRVMPRGSGEDLGGGQQTRGFVAWRDNTRQDNQVSQGKKPTENPIP